MEDILSVELLPVREKRLQAEAETLLVHADMKDEAGNHAEAFELNRKAAEMGNAEAQNRLGVRYYFGNGVKQDYAEAAEWYRKAAEQGDVLAMCNLGYYYSSGEGVKQDYAEAAEWYRMAAEHGDVSAQSSLGCFYENGNGVEQDYAEAVKWYRKAAEQGDSDAQWNLGRCYDSGNGVAKSRTEAEKWYRSAADHGHKSAKQILDSRRMADGIFMVGDHYDRNGKEGVVFEVDASGSHGKIVSMKQSPAKLQWCTDEEIERKVAAGATGQSDGMKNMRAITRIFNWREKYPAFAWCAAQGDSWYLPAVEELKIFALDGEVRDAVDRTLRQHGGDTLFNTTQYWSSSEDGTFSHFAQHVSIKRGADSSVKSREYFVRAVSVF
ncbi:MAG: sel1 repeat family protein [Alistipes sp.]|nr:sel1 repeat family protein [Alistipes sp.]